MSSQQSSPDTTIQTIDTYIFEDLIRYTRHPAFSGILGTPPSNPQSDSPTGWLRSRRHQHIDEAIRNGYISVPRRRDTSMRVRRRLFDQPAEGKIVKKERKQILLERTLGNRSLFQKAASNHCTICLGSMSEKMVILQTCKHAFHQKCIFTWLERKNSCPLCRTSVWTTDNNDTKELEIVETATIQIGGTTS